MRKVGKLALLAALACLSVATPASAQGPFGGLLGSEGGSVAGDPAAAQSQFLSRFTAARIEMNEAQLRLARAFDLKDQVAALEVEQSSLKAGSLDVDGFKKSKELSEGVSAAVSDRMAQGTALDAEGKAIFATALVPLARGTLLTSQLPGAAKSWADAAQAAVSAGSIMEKARLAVNARNAVAIARDLPSFVTLAASNYRKILDFGRSNQIPIPKDATDALGSQ